MESEGVRMSSTVKSEEVQVGDVLKSELALNNPGREGFSTLNNSGKG